MSTVTITQLALDLHTDLANIKAYRETSPAVTRALLNEANAKLMAIGEHLECERRNLIAAEARLEAA